MNATDKPISDFDELRSELAEILGRIERVQGFIESPVVESGIRFAMDAEERAAARYQKRLDALIPPMEESAHQVNPNGVPSAPVVGERLIDRVEKILLDSSVAMTPRVVVAEYQRRGWPPPEKGKMYDGILSTMAYLLKNKGKLVKTERGYLHVKYVSSVNGRMRQPDLSEPSTAHGGKRHTPLAEGGTGS